MSPNPSKKSPRRGTTVKPAARKPKTQEEISKELREQQALDPAKSAVEDYLAPTSRHFGS